jgi:predicted RNA binding protein YcfA (HicA-like mRNA interferase family)
LYGGGALRLGTLGGRDVLREFGFEIAGVRGGHAKLCRVLSSGEVQILTVPLHRELAVGALRAIYRQRCRVVAERDLGRRFYG